MWTCRRLYRLATAITVALLAGCGNMNIERPDGNGDALANAIPDEASAYTETDRCLSTWDYDSVEIAGDEHLLFFGRGDDVWVNKLRTRCPGIETYDALSFELVSNQLCELDLVMGVNRNIFWWERGVSCSLGEFSKVTPAQAQLLREAL